MSKPNDSGLKKVLPFTEHDAAALFVTCETREDVRNASREWNNTDAVMRESRHRTKLVNRAKRNAERAAIRREQQPLHERCAKWKQGDKVYFGVECQVDALDLESMTLHRVKDVDAGAWCRVYQYQPRARRLWLCAPGKPCERRFVMGHFTLREVGEYDIRRTDVHLKGETTA